jgi:ATP citrate (pro-S)-lyase
MKNYDCRFSTLFQLYFKCAEYICSREWGSLTFPPPFGRDAFPEEKYIAELDAKSGSSMKLTIMNPKGNIWTMVAGGGASVIYRLEFIF